MTKKQTAAEKNFKELAKAYKDAFGETLTGEHKSAKTVLTSVEGTSPHKNTTQSSRANWLKRRARTHGFQRSNTNPHEFNFVGVEDAPDPKPPNV